MDVGNNFSNLFEMLRFPSYLCSSVREKGYRWLFFFKNNEKVKEKWRGEKRGLVDEWVNGWMAPNRAGTLVCV